MVLWASCGVPCGALGSVWCSRLRVVFGVVFWAPCGVPGGVLGSVWCSVWCSGLRVVFRVVFWAPCGVPYCVLDSCGVPCSVLKSGRKSCQKWRQVVPKVAASPAQSGGKCSRKWWQVLPAVAKHMLHAISLALVRAGLLSTSDKAALRLTKKYFFNC